MKSREKMDERVGVSCRPRCGIKASKVVKREARLMVAFLLFWNT